MLEPVPRFLGWKYAAHASEAYRERFRRQRKGFVPLRPEQGFGGDSELLGSGAPASLPGLQFRPSVPAGFLPTSVAAGDFDSDGNQDWVIDNAGDNDLWIYRGRGDGTSRLPTILPVKGQTPIWVVTADLRGNGIQDLIVAEADSGTIGVFLGKGDGTFAPEQEYFLGDAPIYLLTGDFNGDGHLDVMAGLVSNGPEVLAVLPGFGDGRLGGARLTNSVVSGAQVPWVSIADVNRDGIPDAILVIHSPFGGGVVAFTGNGDGTFTEGQEVISDFPIPWLVADAGDLNGDGCSDVVAVDGLALGISFLGNCDGSFTQKSFFTPGDIPMSLVMRDIDGDGNVDVVIGSWLTVAEPYGVAAGDLLSVLHGDGHGNLSQAAVFRGEESLSGLAFADVNGDGKVDVISANLDADSGTVFLNDGLGGFGPPSGYTVGYDYGPINSPMSGFLQLDLNADGKKDLALLELPDGATGDMQLVTVLNQGGGRFAPPSRYPVFPLTFDLYSDFILADFRNTGRPDFVGIGLDPDSFISFAPNNGDGTFGPYVMTTPPNSNAIIAVDDFNRDGKLDFVTVGYGDSSNVFAWNMYLGNGDGTFRASTGTPFGGSEGRRPVSLYVGDFNRDGKLDVLTYVYENTVPYTSNDIYESLGNGDGTFQPALKIFSNADPPTLADVNNDGVPDLVTCRDPQANYPSHDQTPVVSIYLGAGDGSFPLAHTYTPYPDGAIVFPNWRGTSFAGGGYCTVADFNQDGKPDVAVFQHDSHGYPYNGFLQYLIGNGDGSFVPSYDTFRFDKPGIPEFAFDIDGNGSIDWLESDTYDASFNYLPAAAGPPFQAGLLAQPVENLGQLEITLDVPSRSDTTFNLSASDPNISISGTTTIPAGTVSKVVDFTFGGAFNPLHVFSITASSGSYSAVAYGNLWNKHTSNGFALGLGQLIWGILAGQSTGDYGISIGVLGAYSTTVNLSCSGLPPQAHCRFDPQTLHLETGGSALGSLFIDTDPSIPVGTYPFSAVASDGDLTASTPGTLEIAADAPDLVATSGINENSAPMGKSSDVDIVIENRGVEPATSVTVNYSVSGPVTLLEATAGQGSCTTQPMVCNLGTIAPETRVSFELTVQPTSVGTVTVGATASETENDGHPDDNSTTLNFPVTDFEMTAESSTATVTAGQTATYQLTLTPVNGSYTAPISFKCSGTPQGATCNVNPNSILLSGNSGQTTVTVTTQASNMKSSAKAGSSPMWFLPVSAAILALVWLPGTRQKRALIGVLMVVVLLGTVSCGGGGSTDTGGGNGGGGNGGNNNGTPPGTYTLTVHAVSGTNEKTTKLTLIVQ